MIYNCELCGKMVETMESKKLDDMDVCYDCYDKAVYKSEGEKDGK